VVSKLGKGLSSLKDLDETFSCTGWGVAGETVGQWRSLVKGDIESIPKFSILISRHTGELPVQFYDKMRGEVLVTCRLNGYLRS